MRVKVSDRNGPVHRCLERVAGRVVSVMKKVPCHHSDEFPCRLFRDGRCSDRNFYVLAEVINSGHESGGFCAHRFEIVADENYGVEDDA